MNLSILIAAVSAGIMVFARMFLGVLAFVQGNASVGGVLIPVAIALLILVGITMRARLAWQWGRLLGLFGGIVLTVGAVSVLLQAQGRPYALGAGVLLGLQGLPLFPMFFALGTREARAHFRLICPQCGQSRPKGGNFLYTRAVCKACQTAWD
jgi:hypothetical protein